VFADATSILVKYTRYGDANLDGIVNLSDFNRLAANFGGSNKIWSQADFTFDGVVNLNDFNRLAGNFGLSAAGPEVTPEDWSALAAAVPEPACAAAWAIAGAATVLRRRRSGGAVCAAERKSLPIRHSPRVRRMARTWFQSRRGPSTCPFTRCVGDGSAVLYGVAGELARRVEQRAAARGRRLHDSARRRR